MPQYLTPGVYVEEIEIGAKPIEGVSTNIAGFLGEAERGPVGPKFITSFDQFKKVYGGYVKGYLAHSVEGYFRNGGASCFVARIIGVGAKEAELLLKGSGEYPIMVEAIKAGTEGNVILIKVDDPETGNPDSMAFTLKVKKTPEDPSPNEYKLSADPNQPNYYLSKNFNFDPVILQKKTADRPKATTQFRSLADGEVGKHAKLQLDSNNSDAVRIKSISPGECGKSINISIENAGLGSENADLFKLNVRYADTEETYDNLSIFHNSGDYFEKRVNGISNLVSITRLGSFNPRPANTNKSQALVNGENGVAVTTSDYTRLGLSAFDRISEISIICAPDESSFTVEGKNTLAPLLEEHCRNHKDRFAILQAGEAPGPIQDLNPSVRSKYVAFYHPWIQILDPATNMPKYVPPCGHIAGIYSRTDAERGVHKAPANAPMSGVLGLKFNIVDADQEILNPRGVNCIRSFPGRGTLVWGARTATLDSAWKYINVSRLFIFVEKSIKEGIRWAVFEPNNERLWSRVKQTVDQFLTTVWRTGALMGTTADQAFFVRCDRTTMTQDDIDNGRLVVMVGIAPVKPAEFVVFRIAQVAKGSDIIEA